MEQCQTLHLSDVGLTCQASITQEREPNPCSGCCQDYYARAMGAYTWISEKEKKLKTP